MKQIYQCYIKTLSPVHIGCDEVYEPMGFVLDESQNELTAFDPISFISQMNDNDKKRFSEICSRGTLESILEIYKFLRRRPAKGKPVQLCSGFVEHYNKTLSIPTNDKKKIQQELNNFAISRTSFLSTDNRPYIPGSSVKGSFRTAYLNSLAQSKNLPTPYGKHAATDLEKKLLSYTDIQNDPFRLVKVSDFMPVGGPQTKIIYAVNIKKESGGAARGPFQIVEAIVPEAVFCGNIIVEEPLSEGTIKRPVTLESLIKSCGAFYFREHDREQNELKAAGISIPEAFFSKGTIPMRLGRHSGAESVTIEGHRNIKIMGARGKKDSWDDHATTLWLVSEQSKPANTKNLQPFGWVELCEMTSVHEDEFEKAEKEWSDLFRKSFEKAYGVTIISGSESDDEPVTIKPASLPKATKTILWDAVITYIKNTGEITASHENKKAFSRDKSIVPEALLEKLKKKSIKAKVEVEPYGNRFRLLRVIEPS